MNDAFMHLPLVYDIPGTQTVTIKKNLVYRQVDGEPLLMDTYAPPGIPPDRRLPAILFIHGGPLPQDIAVPPKEWAVFTSFGRLAAASHLLGITFNHRFTEHAHLEQADGDVSAAIDYARQLAGQLPIDPERLCLWAFSGGGPFLSLGLRDERPYIRCLVSYYSYLDLRSAVFAPAKRPPDELLQRFSPLACLEQGLTKAPSILIARAGLDDPGLNLSIDRFVQAALAANLTLDVLNHPSGPHAFEIFEDTPRTHDILARTIKFIKNSMTAG